MSDRLHEIIPDWSVAYFLYYPIKLYGEPSQVFPSNFVIENINQNLWWSSKILYEYCAIFFRLPRLFFWHLANLKNRSVPSKFQNAWLPKKTKWTKINFVLQTKIQADWSVYEFDNIWTLWKNRVTNKQMEQFHE